MNQKPEYCRLCLEFGISPKTSIKDEQFRAELNAVSNVQFEDNETLSSEVCLECSEKINLFFTFMENVRINQEKLKRSLPLSEIPKENDSEAGSGIFVTNIGDSYVEVDMSEDPTDDTVYGSQVNSCLSIEHDTEEDHAIKEFFSLTCNTCSESFDTFKQLKLHSKEVHDIQAVLQCCNKSFTYRYQMLIHINTHTKPFKCSECGRAFSDQKVLATHFSAKHLSSDEKPFKCEKCPQSFQTEQILRTHKRKHEQAECPICKKHIVNKYLLKQHIKQMHTSDSQKFICDVCGKHFNTKGAFVSHKIVHKEFRIEDGVQCQVCRIWIKRKNRLKQHMSTHQQTRDVKCDICNKDFKDNKSLGIHKARVHVESKFECEICRKRFKLNLHLLEHRAGHMGQKLYTCEFCGMEMNSKGNWYSHRKNKHPVEHMQTMVLTRPVVDSFS